MVFKIPSIFQIETSNIQKCFTSKTKVKNMPWFSTDISSIANQRGCYH